MVKPNIVRNFANTIKNMEKDKAYTENQERLARIAKALGHPARIAIMNFLARRTECYFGDIHEELPIAKATVSQHLKELKEAGLIQGTVEMPKVRYCINRECWRKRNNSLTAFSMTALVKMVVVAVADIFFIPNVRYSTNYV